MAILSAIGTLLGWIGVFVITPPIVLLLIALGFQEPVWKYGQ